MSIIGVVRCANRVLLNFNFKGPVYQAIILLGRHFLKYKLINQTSYGYVTPMSGF